MKLEARSRSATHPAGWAVVLVALAGLFAMHGLGDHGTGAGPEMAGMSAHGTVDHAAMGAAAAATDSVATSTAALLSTPLDHGDHGMASMCITVLVASLLAWTLGRRFHGPRLEPRRVVSAIPSGELSRDRDPPSLTRLSILRC